MYRKLSLVMIFASCIYFSFGQKDGIGPAAGEKVWKQKMELSTFGLWGAGYFWALKKEADPARSRSSLGFRFEALGSDFLLGPSYDWQKVIQRGRYNPLLGFQIGSGIYGDLDLLLDDFFFAATPYGGINTKLGGGVELDIALQLRFNFFLDNFNVVLPSIGFGVKF